MSTDPAKKDEAQKKHTSDKNKRTSEAQALHVAVCEFCNKKDAINLCAFQSPPLAYAAAASAPSDVVAIEQWILDRVNEHSAVFGATAATLSWKLANAVQNALSHERAGDAADPASLAMQTLDVVVADLGKLMVESSQREAIAYVLDRLGAGTCGTRGSESESRRRWLPTLCALTDENGHLSRYGVDAVMLETVRSALAIDVTRWPAIAAGQVIANDFPAGEAEQARDGTQRAILGMLRGGSASAAFHELGRVLDAIVKKPLEDATGHPQLACALSIPTSFESTTSKFAPLDERAPYAALLTALATSSACRHLMTFPASTSDAKRRELATAGATIDRLETILALDKRGLESVALMISPSRDALTLATTRLSTLMKAGSEDDPPPKKSESTPKIEGKATPSDKGAGTTSGASKRSEIGTAAALALNAAAMVVRGSFDAIGVAATATESELTNYQPKLANARKLFKELDGVLGAVVPVSDQDWTKTIVGSLRIASEHNDAEAGALLEFAMILVAVVSAKDGDAIARALEDVVAPVGGWRAKLTRRGHVTLSAEPSIMSAFELRHGAYDGRFESWRMALQAPTLSMPIGIDVAWGHDDWTCALFFSILDPGGFLQYDVDSGAKLPGARLLTAFAPGIGGRVTLGKSSVSLMPMLIYRPGLRTTMSSWTGGGADALQFGLWLSVDVPILDLGSGRPL
ncbi:MAG: hypothetical protein ACHREM_12890 [Polyangiales bacterium]